MDSEKPQGEIVFGWKQTMGWWGSVLGWGELHLRDAVETCRWLWCHEHQRGVVVVGVLFVPFVFTREVECCLETAVGSRKNVCLSSWCVGSEWRATSTERPSEKVMSVLMQWMCVEHSQVLGKQCAHAVMTWGDKHYSVPKPAFLWTSFWLSQGKSVRWRQSSVESEDVW